MALCVVRAGLTKPNETEAAALWMRNRENAHNPTAIQVTIILTPIDLKPRINIRSIIHQFNHPRLRVRAIC
jgi:hypothetical protein